MKRRDGKELIIVLIVLFLLSLVKLAHAAEDRPMWVDHKPLLEVLQWVMAGLLAYVTWSIRRFIKRQDNIHKKLSEAVKVLIQLVTEHRKNHDCSSVNIDELMKEEEV